MSSPPATVKAWTYTRGGYLSCVRQTTQTPKSTLSPTELQIQVHAVGLNPVDIQLMNLPIWSLPTLGIEKTIGCDFAGTVLRAGPRAPFAAGDALFGLSATPMSAGCASQIVTLDSASGAVLLARKPPALSAVQAASLPVVFLTARSCIALVEPYMRAGGTLAVLGGSSSCGMYAVRLAVQRGWNVVATCSGKNVGFVRGLGAGEVIDYTQASVADGVRAARADAVIDCVGGTACVGLARRYVTIVGDKTDRTLMGGSALYLTSPKMLLRWFLGWLGVGGKYDCIILEKKREYLEEAATLTSEQVTVDSTFAFEDMKEALEKLASGKVRGKVVVEVKQEV